MDLSSIKKSLAIDRMLVKQRMMLVVILDRFSTMDVFPCFTLPQFQLQIPSS
jgi:hypothetical protein